MILWGRLLADGLWIAGLFSVFVVGTLRLDRTWWLGDYPPDIREAVGEPSPRVSLVWSKILGLLALAGLIFLFFRSASGYLDEATNPTYLGVLLHCVLLFQFVNLWDVVVLDWLLFVTIQPKWIVFPGTEGMAGYKDYGFHFRGSFLHPTPWIGAAALALVVGSAAWWLG